MNYRGLKVCFPHQYSIFWWGDLRASVASQQKQLESLIDRVALLLSSMHSEVDLKYHHFLDGRCLAKRCSFQSFTTILSVVTPNIGILTSTWHIISQHGCPVTSLLTPLFRTLRRRAFTADSPRHAHCRGLTWLWSSPRWDAQRRRGESWMGFHAAKGLSGLSMEGWIAFNYLMQNITKTLENCYGWEIDPSIDKQDGKFPSGLSWKILAGVGPAFGRDARGSCNRAWGSKVCLAVGGGWCVMAYGCWRLFLNAL